MTAPIDTATLRAALDTLRTLESTATASEDVDRAHALRFTFVSSVGPMLDEIDRLRADVSRLESERAVMRSRLIGAATMAGIPDDTAPAAIPDALACEVARLRADADEWAARAVRDGEIIAALHADLARCANEREDVIAHYRTSLAVADEWSTEIVRLRAEVRAEHEAGADLAELRELSDPVTLVVVLSWITPQKKNSRWSGL